MSEPTENDMQRALHIVDRYADVLGSIGAVELAAEIGSELAAVRIEALAPIRSVVERSEVGHKVPVADVQLAIEEAEVTT